MYVRSSNATLIAIITNAKSIMGWFRPEAARPFLSPMIINILPIRTRLNQPAIIVIAVSFPLKEGKRSAADVPIATEAATPRELVQIMATHSKM